MESACGYTDVLTHFVCCTEECEPRKEGVGLVRRGGGGGGELGGWRKKDVILIDSYDTKIHINYYTQHLFFHLLLYAIDHL